MTFNLSQRGTRITGKRNPSDIQTAVLREVHAPSCVFAAVG
jgi:hypothetical protein